MWRGRVEIAATLAESIVSIRAGESQQVACGCRCSAVGVLRILPVTVVLVLTVIFALPISFSAGAAPHGCTGHRSADAAAKELARFSEVVAETYATDHNGYYGGLSPARLRSLASSITITARHARRHHEDAYLSAASGTADSYIVTAKALNGDTFTIRRLADGGTEHRATVCGKTRSW